MTTFAPTAIRASELSRCARMAAYRGLGAEAIEPDEITRRYFARGHLYTEYVARQLVAKYGADDVEREKIVHWPLGEGHIDAFIRSLGMVVEIKSSVTPTLSSPMFDMAVEQNRIYQHFTPEARTGALYIVNPSSLAGEDVYQVELTDDDRERIDSAVASVHSAITHGESHLPDRICTRPSQARGRMCPFAHVCFDGWEPPDETETITDPAVVDAAQRLFHIKREKAQHSAAIKALEEGEKQAQAELAENVDKEALVGPYVVKRSHVVRQPTFQPKAFEAAGHSLEPLAEFMKPGAEYDTWKVEMADEAGEIEYGEVPF